MASTTNPADWFLPTVPFTNGNTATPLIDGESYYRDLVNAFVANSSFSNILICGWRLKKETVVDNASGLTFESLLTNRVSDFSKVKSMLWYVPGTIGDFGAGHGVENSDFTEFVISNGGQAILDNRLPAGRFASQHQKYIIVDGDSSQAAYIGGIDVAPDRMDSIAHDSSIPRMEESEKAWHDVQLKLEGPAVGDAMRLFQERWNDPRKPHAYPAAGGNAPDPFADSEISQVSPTGGTHSVQLLSSYACSSKDGDGVVSAYPFASQGRYHYRDALIRAIDNAEHYVYIEDQYCWPSEVVDALGAAVNRGVAVILVLAAEFDPPGLAPYHNFLRSRALESLVSRDGAKNRVFVYQLERSTVDPLTQLKEMIFVHTKTMIIDDKYLVIGSGNLNRRSMKTDTELGGAVVDTDSVSSTIRGVPQQVGRLAVRYRKALWSEHLGSSAADDPFDAEGFPAGFPKNDALVGHVRRHKLADPRYCNPSIIPFGFFNANTKCGPAQASRTTGSRKPSQTFKGFPLLDFVDPNGFSLDHVLRSTSLRTEIERHIKSFAVGKSKSKGGHEKHEASGAPRGSGHANVNLNANAMATADVTSGNLQQQLEQFLDGLYLGCFKSSVVQLDARRPPRSYIYDIGFNTDKLTGFIVANPFDTLLTFGPRGRHSPYGDLDPAASRMPRAPNMRVRRSGPERSGTGRTGGALNPDFMTTFGTVVGNDRGGDGPRASIICDLNIRIMTNHRQELQQLSFYGDTMKVHLSKGLVQPVERSAGNEWITTRKRLALAMGNRMITLRRNRLPTWGGPLDVGGATVSITASSVVAKLHRVDLGGTVEKPLIVFDDVEILT